MRYEEIPLMGDRLTPETPEDKAKLTDDLNDYLGDDRRLFVHVGEINDNGEVEVECNVKHGGVWERVRLRAAMVLYPKREHMSADDSMYDLCLSAVGGYRHKYLIMAVTDPMFRDELVNWSGLPMRSLEPDDPDDPFANI